MRFKMGSKPFVGALAVIAIIVISEFVATNSLSISLPHRHPHRPGPVRGARPPPFSHRMGPPSHREHSVEEDTSDEDENESQARVEPQITPMNRDECLAKLLCGMSVPVTGGGAPKNGYYSEYANIVAKFFEAFPLEEEEQQNLESMEAYDDYSVEQEEKAKPARINSKLKNVNDHKSSGPKGLQLFDLAIINHAAKNFSDKVEDDERNARQSNIDLRFARARKMVAKLGEKLQNIRQCQQISGCPFTFKQLRSKLKTSPSVSPNVPLSTDSGSSSPSSSKPNANANANSDPILRPPVKYTYDTNNYKPLIKAKPKPQSTELSLGTGVVETNNENHKGNDDELEEFFGSPPVFGASGRPFGYGAQSRPHPHSNKQQQIQKLQEIQKLQSVDVEYFPYNPPVTKSKAKVQSGSPFSKKRIVGYKFPSFVKRTPTGDNDEFDDVNLSTGPIALITGDDAVRQQQLLQLQQAQPQYAVEGQKQTQPTTQDSGQDGEDDVEDNNDDDGGSDEDYEDDDEDAGDEEDEEDEEYEDDGEEEDDDDEEKVTKKKNVTEKVIEQPAVEAPKKKITQYKNPSKETQVFIEEFPIKKNTEDDELDHPDNAWTKLAFATSSALIKEPENRKKTELEEKNDEKLKLSTEKKSSEDEDTNSDESNEEDEEDYEDKSRSEQKKKLVPATVVPTTKSDKVESHDDEVEEDKSRNRRKRPSKKSKNRSKLTVDDEEEFDRVSSIFSKPTSTSSKKPKRKHSRKKSRNSAKKPETKNDQPKKDKKKDTEEDEEDEPPRKTAPLLEIGGRPIVPRPEKETQQSKKTGALSRFKFSLIRPFGAQPKEEVAASVYHAQTTPKLKAPPSYEPSLPSYSSSSLSSHYKSPPPSSSSTSNSFRNEIFGGNKNKPSHQNQKPHQSSYIPSTSFGSGSSNNGQVGNGEFLSTPSASSKVPSLYTFPFGSPFSTLKTLFKRPSSSQNQEFPTANAPLTPVSAFVHRPAGPESNNYKKRTNPEPSSRSEEIDEELKIDHERSVRKNKNDDSRGRTGIKRTKSKKKDGKKNYSKLSAH